MWFCNSGYYPPIRYCPLEFIFEICSDETEPVITPATPVDGAQAEDDEDGLYFTYAWFILLIIHFHKFTQQQI